MVVLALPPPYAMARSGAMRVSVGTGFSPGAVMVNGAALEAPPPGAGLNTVTPAWPGAAISAAAMLARRWPPSTNVVARSAPFQRTLEPARKLAPYTSRVKAAPPAAADVGPR